MASQISLGYHNLVENQRHNIAQEQEAIRSNNLLDNRTRDIADKDRRSREIIASADRVSRENIASADRDSRYLIAAEDRDSREFVNERSLANQRQIAKLDRLSRENIAQLDRESREYINDLQLQNALDRIEKQFETNLYYQGAANLMSGNPWSTRAATSMGPFIGTLLNPDASEEDRKDALDRANNWLRTMDLYASMQAMVQGTEAFGAMMGGWGSAMRGVNPGSSNHNSSYYTYSPSYVPQFSPRTYFGDSIRY